MTDKICNSVLDKMAKKYAAGVEEHGGKGLADAPADLKLWLMAWQEEMMDAAMYIEKLIQDLDD